MYDKKTQNKGNIREVNSLYKDNSFFCENVVNTLLTKLNNKQYKDTIERNNLLLDLIRIKQPISKYRLAKISGISYTTIKRILKEFVFCNLVYEKISMGDNGMYVKIIYLNEKENSAEKEFDELMKKQGYDFTEKIKGEQEAGASASANASNKEELNSGVENGE